MSYVFTEDGGLEPLKENFTFTLNQEWQGLTTVTNLTVTVNGQQTTLPAGTPLFVTSTDNAGIL